MNSMGRYRSTNIVGVQGIRSVERKNPSHSFYWCYINDMANIDVRVRRLQVMYFWLNLMCSSKNTYMQRTYTESYLNIDLTASKRNMNTTLMVLNKNSSTFYPVFILQKYIIFYMINQHNSKTINQGYCSSALFSLKFYKNDL